MTTRTMRAAAIAALFLGTTSMGALAPALAQTATQQFDFDIPSRPLAQTVNQIGRTAGLSVVFVEGRAITARANPVHGTMPAAQALGQALAGTGLGWRFSNANTVQIYALAPAASLDQADGSVVLETVVLQGRGDATEGSGSYTTAATAAATRLPVSLRETPQATTVLTDQRIQDQNLSSVPEALAYTTGVTFDRGETERGTVYARGFSVNNYTVDGLDTPDQAEYGGTQTSTALYDRVEVVRGATGLVKSSGEPSAAVNLVRKRATATQLTGHVAARIGSWSTLGGEFDIAGPLSADGRIRGRFIADAIEGDSFLDRYHRKTQSYLATLEADLTEDTTLIAGVEYRKHAPTGTTWGNWPLVFADGTPTDFPRGFSTGLDWTRWDSDMTTGYLRVEHEFGNGWTAQANLSRSVGHYDSRLFYTYGLPDPLTGIGVEPYAGKFSRTQANTAGSIDLSGPVELFGRSHDLSFGLSGSRSDWHGSNAFAAGLPPIGSIFDWDGSYAEPTWGSANPVAGEPTYQLSAYSAARLSVSDRANVILGARYSRWKQAPRSFSNVTPYLGLTYDLSDTVSAYASYTEIFNPQDYTDVSGAYLDPEIGKGYEIGAKAELFDGALDAVFALYRTQKDNVAVEVPGATTPTGDQAYAGVKGITTKGLELELSGELRPGWNLFFGASRFSSKQPDGGLHDSFLPRSGVKLFTSYSLPGAWSKLTLGGGLRWQDGSYVDIEADAGNVRFHQGSVTTVDLMARYDFSDTLAAQLNVYNAFDKDYHVLRSGDNAPRGAPMNAMLTLTSRF